MSFVRKEVTEPIYESVILFLVGGDEASAEAEAMDWFAQKGVEPAVEKKSDVEGEGRTFRGGQRHFVHWRDSSTGLGTIVHELIHIGVTVIAESGIKISPKNDEPLAYYCGWLAQNCPAHVEVNGI